MATNPRVRLADADQPWSRTLPARLLRELSICSLFAPIIAFYARREVSGRQRLQALPGPAVFVANHCSHVDTPVILRCLPARLRRRTAVAAAADYFYTDRMLARAVSLAFGTVPLERRAPRSRARTLAQLHPLMDARWSILLFPEGTRSRDGRIGPLHLGAAALAAAHRLPIVPIHVSGTAAAMPVGSRWMARPQSGGRFARHTIRVSFGAPITVRADDDPAAVMDGVRQFMVSCEAQSAATARQRVRAQKRDGTQQPIGGQVGRAARGPVGGQRSQPALERAASTEEPAIPEPQGAAQLAREARCEARTP